MYWDNYGIIYQSSFDSIPRNNGNSESFNFTIYKKNYTGQIQSVLCSANPISHSYLSDEPTAPIKGSELRLRLLNIDNQLPLSLFYSNEDDAFKIQLNGPTGALFTGYLVQEDCIEIMSDIAHEIELNFTDNLGILKDISFSLGNQWSVANGADIRNVNSPLYVVAAVGNDASHFVVTSLDGNPLANDTLFIYGTLYADGTYTITKVTPFSTTGYNLYVSEVMPILPIGSPTVNFKYLTVSDINSIIPLGTCLRICLQATGILSELRYGGNIKIVSSTTTKDILNEVLIDGNTFQKTSNSWDSCYEVLEKICTRFKITLFQQNGYWFAVRWQELRYYNNLIPSLFYDAYLVNIGTAANATKKLTYGDKSDIKSGITQSLIRPYQFYTETYNYEQPSNLMLNSDLSELGDYVKTVPDIWNLGNTTKDYQFPYWDRTGNIYSGQTRYRYIRVVYNQYGNEIERYAVGGTPFYFVNKDNVMGPDVQVNKGDRIKITFSFKSTTDISGPNSVGIYIEYRNHPSSFGPDAYLQFDGKWGGTAPNYAIGSGDNWKDWKDIDIYSDGIPGDGIVRILLPTPSNLDNLAPRVSPYVDRENVYRNINFEYIPYANATQGVIGQSHTSYQGGIIKNNSTIEIYLDSASKNFAKGCLFIDGITNLIQNKAVLWQDGRTTNDYNLGEITTKQEVLWRKNQRIKLEGTLFPIVTESGEILTMNTVILLDIFPGKFFIFGKLDMDYKENTANFTLYEIWKNGENDMVPIHTPPPSHVVPVGILKDKSVNYIFKYLYK